MAKKKKSSDVNVLASQIVAEATQEQPTDNIQSQKNPAAVSLGRLGGLKGGPARAKRLSPKKRKEIAQKAAKTRWSSKS
jgi:methenyltetrahydromethanopterin cyclohydrolase